MHTLRVESGRKPNAGKTKHATTAAFTRKPSHDTHHGIQNANVFPTNVLDCNRDPCYPKTRLSPLVQLLLIEPITLVQHATLLWLEIWRRRLMST